MQAVRCERVTSQGAVKYSMSTMLDTEGCRSASACNLPPTSSSFQATCSSSDTLALGAHEFEGLSLRAKSRTGTAGR